MATTKRRVSTTRQKKRTSTKSATAPKMTIKIAGVGGKKRVYRKKVCSKTKGAANASATGYRSRGSTARVIKSTSEGKTVYCVYVGPKAKAPFGGKKRTSTKTTAVSGTRKRTTTTRRRRRAA